MSAVNITDVKVVNSVCHFSDPFEFEVTLEYISPLNEELEIEFQVIYVSSAKFEERDQMLEHITVGPIPAGSSRFTLNASPPNPATIDESDLLGVTVVLIRALFKSCEFVRIGYLINNEYQDEMLRLAPPPVPRMDMVYRNILAEKPRVTRFHINWEDPKATDYPRLLAGENEDEDMDDVMQMNSDDQLISSAVATTSTSFMESSAMSDINNSQMIGANGATSTVPSFGFFNNLNSGTNS